MEWLRDATNALDLEDSLLNKRLNNSFLNYNRFFSRFFSPEFKILSYVCNLDRPKLFQMIVSDQFLKQRETEAFLKLNSCFSTEFTHLKNT